MNRVHRTIVVNVFLIVFLACGDEDIHHLKYMRVSIPKRLNCLTEILFPYEKVKHIKANFNIRHIARYLWEVAIEIQSRVRLAQLRHKMVKLFCSMCRHIILLYVWFLYSYVQEFP